MRRNEKEEDDVVDDGKERIFFYMKTDIVQHFQSMTLHLQFTFFVWDYDIIGFVFIFLKKNVKWCVRKAKSTYNLLLNLHIDRCHLMAFACKWFKSIDLINIDCLNHKNKKIKIMSCDLPQQTDFQFIFFSYFSEQIKCTTFESMWISIFISYAKHFI